MSPKQKPIAAAIYCRISLDREGDGLGVKRQEDLCRKLARLKGWKVAQVYADNDVSAFNGKPRTAFKRLLDDLEEGHRDAVICVDLDRLTRRPAELEDFMALADRRGIALANVSGDTDLSTSDGRFKARIMGAVARQESEKKSERVQREAEQAARMGKPRGSRRAFGYEPDRVTIRASEAELIKEAATRVLAGETVPMIARDWNERGIPTQQKAAHGWGATALMGILRNPRIAGLRAYKGEVVAEGTWPAVIDRATFERLQSRIRFAARVGRPHSHLLSGIARCGNCENALWTSWRYDGQNQKVERYACVKRPGGPGCGTLTVVATPLDEIVREAVITALSGPGLSKMRSARAGSDQEQQRAARELADAESRLEEIASDYAAGTIGRREWLAARAKLAERTKAAQRVLDRRSGVAVSLPPTEKALRERWDSGDVAWRRAVIGTVLERVVVKPVKRASPKFDSSRVKLVWRH